MGPHPYPWMVRELHRVIGDEAREQCAAAARRRAIPTSSSACVGGGSNAAGIFSGFADTRRRAGRRRAGRRRRRRPGRARRRARLQSYLMQDEWGQVLEAAVDLGRPRLPGRRPRARATSPTSAGPATRRSPTTRCSTRSSCCRRTEGIIPALEPAHALAWVSRARRRAGRPDRAGQPVGPGRQGRRPDDGHPRAIERRLEAAAAALETHAAATATPAASCSCPYVTGGLGRDWADVVRAVADAGADAIEIGIPFSDPVMDGPVIQEASRAGAGRGGHAGRASSTSCAARRRRPARGDDLLQHRLPHRATSASPPSLADAGVAGAILPDLPLEESGPWAAAADAAGVETVLLAAPDRARRPPAPQSARGPGASCTASACSASPASGTRWPRSRRGHRRRGSRRSPTSRCSSASASPTPARRSRCARQADGVIVGSALVRRLLDGEGPDGRGGVHRLGASRPRRRLTSPPGAEARPGGRPRRPRLAPGEG